MNQFICLLGLICCRILNSSPLWEVEFDYSTYLDANDDYKLYWSNLDNDIIEIGIEVQGTGWIALGISPNSQMPSSDIMFAWINDDGDIYLQDRYTVGRSYPLLDEQQDLTLIEGFQVNGVTSIRFTRPKFVCDENDLSFSVGTTRIIYAWNADTDPEEEYFDDSTVIWHDLNRGSHSLNFDTGVNNVVELEDDVEYFDMLMDNVEVPSSDTTYYCKLFQLPVFNETHHIVRMGAVITPGNEGIVHHFVAYSCPSIFVEDESHIGHEDVCNQWDTNMPSKECISSTSIYAWAVGGNDLYFPINAGFPLSGDSSLHYILLEIHYDNPQEAVGMIDSSGIRIYHTEQLREYDAGVLSFGIASTPLGHFLPQGMNNILNNGFCSSDCTKNTIPESGTHVFGSMLHAHQIGASLSLRIIRDGIELTPIDANYNYDFNYQQTVSIDPEYTLYPGDEFIIDCTYNTASRGSITYGGESSREEMCFAYLYVYPEPDISACITMHEIEGFTAWAKAAEMNEYLSGDIDNAVATFNFSTLVWNDKLDGNEEFYNELYENEEYSDRYMICATPEGDLVIDFVDSEFIQQIPSDFEEYDMNIISCDDDSDSNISTEDPDDTSSSIKIIGNIQSSVLSVAMMTIYIYGW